MPLRYALPVTLLVLVLTSPVLARQFADTLKADPHAAQSLARQQQTPQARTIPEGRRMMRLPRQAPAQSAPVSPQRLRAIMQAAPVSAPARALRGGSCGDGLPNPGEQCDDGNATDGDGCSASCEIEAQSSCTYADGTSLLQDGGWEQGGLLLGMPNPFWSEASDPDIGGELFTPICSEAFCLFDPNAQFAVQGGNFLWFGGGVQGPGGGAATASVTQSVSIPAGTVDLSFYALRDLCFAGQGDMLTLSVDATPVFTLDCEATDTDWVRYTADISAFADDTSHDITFTGVTTATAGAADYSNFFVDFASLGALTPGPSVCTNVCGDSIPNAGEQCDDGNVADGDGCSASCEVEAGFECTAAIAGGDEDAVGDPSFELGGVATSGGSNPFWSEDDDGFLPLIRDGSVPGGLDLARSGVHYVRFGGVPNTAGSTAMQSVTQMLSIPTTATQLSLSVLRTACAPSPAGDADGITLTLDGNEVFSLPCDSRDLAYGTYTIDLASAPGGPYNDDAMHLLVLAGASTGIDTDGTANGIDWTTMYVDDISALTGDTTPPVPSMCTGFEVCAQQTFDPGVGGDLTQLGWTVFNAGSLSLDWGSTDDGVCLSTGNSGNLAGTNLTGGTGEAACVDTDQAGAGLVDAWMCSDLQDLSAALNPSMNVLANYQVFNQPTAEDLFEIRVGEAAPDLITVADYEIAFSATASLGGLNGGAVRIEGPADAAAQYWCFHYVADFDWWAQVDDFTLQAEACAVMVEDDDEDGVANDADNCVALANPDQLDVDNDGIGNLCDGDFDQNCAVDFVDLQVFKAVVFQNGSFAEDMDGNGMVDFGDLSLFKAEIFNNYTSANPSGIAGNLCTTP